jgi:hypothetical protein
MAVCVPSPTRDCLDRNDGGILIAFDRVFGTVASAPKDEPPR